jgi:predicted permease
VPGVTSSAAASALPLEGETWVNGIGRAEGASSAEDRPSANYRFVSPEYFATVGTPLSAGHPFTASDRGRPVVVVSERVARTLWPREDAIGKLAQAGRFGTVEVVGVAADVRTVTLEQEGSLVVYLPLWVGAPSQGTIVVRTAGAPAVVAPSVRNALRRIDPTVPVPKVRTMADVVSATVAARRFELGLLALFALMALVTASVGIYGVISQSLSNRTRELGVRMALGASPRDVRRLVLREGLTPVSVGLIAGVVASIVAARTIESLLFGVRADDPVTIAAVCALLGLVALVACLIPARRAAGTQLSSMLRAE